MTVRQLQKLLEPLDDDLSIIVVAPVMDDDGDQSEAWFGIREVTCEMDSDIAEDYARFRCVPIEET